MIFTAIFGEIKNPTTLANGPEGFFNFLSTIFKFSGVIAGLFFVAKIILAGFGYLSANGDEKKVAAAWATIWQSIIGLIIVSSAFVIAGIIGYIFGIDILNPTIVGPNEVNLPVATPT